MIYFKELTCKQFRIEFIKGNVSLFTLMRISDCVQERRESKAAGCSMGQKK